MRKFEPRFNSIWRRQLKSDSYYAYIIYLLLIALQPSSSFTGLYAVIPIAADSLAYVHAQCHLPKELQSSWQWW